MIKCRCRDYQACPECKEEYEEINQAYKDGDSLAACRKFFDGNEFHNATIDEVLERIKNLELALSMLIIKIEGE